MSYIPKHAKPASLNTSSNANITRRQYALYAISGARGRHAASASVVRQFDSTTSAPELQAA